MWTLLLLVFSVIFGFRFLRDKYGYVGSNFHSPSNMSPKRASITLI